MLMDKRSGLSGWRGFGCTFFVWNGAHFLLLLFFCPMMVQKQKITSFFFFENNTASQNVKIPAVVVTAQIFVRLGAFLRL
jgi:hypothetical protein